MMRSLIFTLKVAEASAHGESPRAASPLKVQTFYVMVGTLMCG
jgi:hypothetical protein